MSPQLQKQFKEVDPEKDVLAAATFLPLRHRWNTLSFFMMSHRVQKQLGQTPGVIKFGLSADLLRKRYYTYSVWDDRASLNAFLRAEPHATAMKRIETWGGNGAAFTDWETKGSSVDWDEAMQRLKNPNRQYGSKGQFLRDG